MNMHIFPVWRKRLYKACAYLSSAILAAMLVVIFAQIVLRNTLKVPMAWAEELSTYLMISLALFGSVFVMYEKGHLYVDSIIVKFPVQYRLLCHLVTSFLQCVFFTCILYFCIASLQHASNVRAMSLGISMLLPYLALPIAFSLMLVESLFQCIDIVAKMRRQRLGGSL